MQHESNAIEQAISRAIRDNLERIQRTTEELNQAVNDVVAACASSKPTNALPPMLRAQSTAASIAAALEVLSRFVALTLQPGPRSPLEAEMTRLASTLTAEQARHAQPVQELTSASSEVASVHQTEPTTQEASHPAPIEPPKYEPIHQPPPPAAHHEPELEPPFKSESLPQQPEPLDLPSAGSISG